MIKILPLLIFPILFLIFFINVNILTPNFERNNKETSDLDKYKNDEKYENFKDISSNRTNNKKKEDEKSKEIKNYDDYSDTPDLKDKDNKLSDKITNSIEEKNKTLNKNELDSESVQPSIKKNKIQVKPKPKPDNIRLSSKLSKLQFGAFSKMKNAEDQKERINKIISNKFPELSNKLKVIEENRLFKLILISESNSMAKSICDFSKSKKMSCLILKK